MCKLKKNLRNKKRQNKRHQTCIANGTYRFRSINIDLSFDDSCIFDEKSDIDEMSGLSKILTRSMKIIENKSIDDISSNKSSINNDEIDNEICQLTKSDNTDYLTTEKKFTDIKLINKNEEINHISLSPVYFSEIMERI